MSHNSANSFVHVLCCRWVFPCVFMLTLINYPPHAGDLLRLLITSWSRPTGGWFSCTNRESISVWGLVYLCTCTHVSVCVWERKRASKKDYCVWHEKKHRIFQNLMILAWSHCHYMSCCSVITHTPKKKSWWTSFWFSVVCCSFSSALGLWCDVCLYYELSAWSSRAPYSLYWNHRH